MCAYCLMQKELTYENLEVHHVVKLNERPDLLLEDSNLICLCVKHHKQADCGEISKTDLYRLIRLRDTPGGGAG